jgi:RNA polymerase primary sigma factor
MIKLWLIILLVLSLAGKLPCQSSWTYINFLINSLDYVVHSFKLPLGRFSFNIKATETLVISSNIESSYSMALTFSLQDPVVGLDHDLLTREEEVLYCRQWKVYSGLEERRNILSRKLGRKLTTEELSTGLDIPLEKLVSYLSKGAVARDKLINSNLRLIYHFAKQYARGDLKPQDLIMDGCEGLFNAVVRFDYTRGVHFPSYASWWIKNALSIAAFNKARSHPISASLRNKIKSYNRAFSRLRVELGRDPSPSEVGQNLKYSDPQIELLLRARQKSWSGGEGESAPYSDAFDGKRRITVLGYNVFDPEDSDDETTEDSEDLRADIDLDSLAGKLKFLNERDSLLLKMRYGLRGQKRRKLREIASYFNVSKARIIKMETNALSKVKYK